VLWPLLSAIVLVALLALPAVLGYRRRENATATQGRVARSR
jgi:hypothetical protein